LWFAGHLLHSLNLQVIYYKFWLPQCKVVIIATIINVTNIIRYCSNRFDNVNINRHFAVNFVCSITSLIRKSQNCFHSKRRFEHHSAFVCRAGNKLSQLEQSWIWFMNQKIINHFLLKMERMQQLLKLPPSAKFANLLHLGEYVSRLILLWTMNICGSWWTATLHFFLSNPNR
jgi:hypothetical protein